MKSFSFFFLGYHFRLFLYNMQSEQQQTMVVENTKSTSSPTSPASSETVHLLHADDNQSKSDNQPTKRKRNLPGMPDPEAEVIALSPKSLLTTNRFVCEICNKGFQRDQNLQLHRRGHNLPWKLRQRTSNEVKKRVYVCPEPTCVHHDPSRALGDLTGIKKHYSRKHGEKKFKCEKCSKKYAVQSDWKAHMKTCGTREYRCDCGTLFSRRDSFITHRAFCDALAQESARSQPPLTMTASSGDNSKAPVVVPVAATSSPPPPPLTPSTGVLSPVQSVQSSGKGGLLIYCLLVLLLLLYVKCGTYMPCCVEFGFILCGEMRISCSELVSFFFFFPPYFSCF